MAEKTTSHAPGGPPGKIPLLAFILVLALYLPCLQNDFVNWDDDTYIHENPYVTKSGFELTDYLFTPDLGYPLPLQVAVYRFLFHFVGPNPIAYHLVNVLLHALSAALLASLLCRFVFPRAALFGALLWAFHPLVVEPVAWATGLKDVMAAAFFLVALAGFVDLLRNTVPRGALLKFVAGSVLAILSKPTMVSLIPLMICYPLVFRRSAHLKKTHVWAPLVLFGVVSSLMACAGYMSQHVIRTTRPVAGAGDYIAGILHAFGLQVRHAAWPVDLLPKYLEESFTFSATHVLGAAAGAFTVGAAVWLYRRQRPAAAFFLAWFLLTYAPVSNLVPLVRVAADSYFYLPLAGIAGLAACLLQHLRNRRGYARLKPYLAAALCALLVMLAVGSFFQQRLWKNSQTLWRPVLEQYPDRASAAEKMAEALQFAGKKMQALELHRAYEPVYRRELRMPPYYPPLEAELGRVDRARRLFAWALENVPEERIMHINFITFLLNYPGQLDAETSAPARRSMPFFAEHLLEIETRPFALARAALFAQTIGLFNVAEVLFARAFELKPLPDFARKGAEACRKQGRNDCQRRWSPE